MVNGVGRVLINRDLRKHVGHYAVRPTTFVSALSMSTLYQKRTLPGLSLASAFRHGIVALIPLNHVTKGPLSEALDRCSVRRKTDV